MTRHALIPLQGKGAKLCDDCGACVPVDTETGAACGVFGDGIRLAPLRLSPDKRCYTRLPQCLSAEREATRLRAIEAAARSYVEARERWLDAGTITATDEAEAAMTDGRDALRAALKE